MNFDPWIIKVKGQYIDEDLVWGSQCVDLIVNLVKWFWPGISRALILPNGNAKDLFARANSDYFEKIANDKNNPNQLPQKGDIAVFSATPTNADGHIVFVLWANANGMQVLQQDGSIDKDRNGNADGVTHEVFRPWGKSPCIGWLRPKVNNQPAPKPQEGGSAVNDKFTNEQEVKPFYVALRGNEATVEERKGWIGRPKIEFITSQNTATEARNNAGERIRLAKEVEELKAELRNRPATSTVVAATPDQILGGELVEKIRKAVK